MSIQPVQGMRVSFSMQTQLLLEQMRTNMLRLFDYQQQLASGQRMLVPSDDPSAASRALRLSDLLERYNQLQRNGSYADRFTAATDTALGDVRQILNEASAIASQNVGVLADADQRAASAAVLDGLISQLVAIANRQQESVYLFGGRIVDRPPFVEALGGVLYQGDAGDLGVNVDGNGPLTVNVTGDKVFGAMSAEVRGWLDLDPAVLPETRLADVRGYNGQGIRLGSIQITEVGGVGSFTVDLSGASTMGDIVEAIDAAAAAAGATVDASLTTNGLRLSVGGGYSIAVNEVGTGRTASDLGIVRTTPVAGPLVGYDVNPRLTLTTPVDALRGGTGFDKAGGLQLTNAGQTVILDLSGAGTVQDILNAINGTNLGVLARINEQANGLDVVSRVSGSTLSIGENSGVTASTLGIRSFHYGTSLAALNDGRGVGTVAGTDLRIVAKDGTAFEVDLDGATTVADVLVAIDAAAAAAGVAVSASLAASGNGIRLTDATGGAGALRVERANLSPAVDDLGLAKETTGTELVGDDVHLIAPTGVFATLAGLREALLSNDSDAITRAGTRLASLTQVLGQWQGRVGALAKSVQGYKQRVDDALLVAQTLLSEARDADFAEVITRFTQAQTIMQANLMTGSRAMQLSLLDFLQ